MRALGLNVGKGFIRFAVVEGTLAAPVLADRTVLKRGTPHELDFDPALPLPERMVLIRQRFEGLLDRVGADRVAYRMHNGRGLDQEQVAIFHYPWGVLNLLCAERSLPCTEFLSASLTFKRFKLPNDTKPMERVDDLLPEGSKWDDNIRYAACAAWGALA